MGVAAYRRGSSAISRGICAEYGCIGCQECRPYVPQPRPAGWGNKAAERANKAAAGLLRFCDARPGEDALADMVQVATGVGRKTATAAAIAALTEHPHA
jgi:hypothetical protein